MPNMETKQLDVAAAAFLGDAVYEAYVRKHIVAGGAIRGADALHRAAVRYVRAEGQAAVVRGLPEGFLSAEEQEILRRGRNKRTGTKSRSADPVSYHLATALEALIGQLVLTGRQQRAEEIMAMAIGIIDEKERSQ